MTKKLIAHQCVGVDSNESQGDWKEGARHGKGEATYSGGAKYAGNFSEGLFDGKGKFTWADSTYYDGEWCAGTQKGTGKKVPRAPARPDEAIWVASPPFESRLFPSSLPVPPPPHA